MRSNAWLCCYSLRPKSENRSGLNFKYLGEVSNRLSFFWETTVLCRLLFTTYKEISLLWRWMWLGVLSSRNRYSTAFYVWTNTTVITKTTRPGRELVLASDQETSPVTIGAGHLEREIRERLAGETFTRTLASKC